MNRERLYFNIRTFLRFFLSAGLISLLLFFVVACQEPVEDVYQTDVLVIGGGCSGVAAGIQAARSGVEVILVEETPWLGGMLTASGVSAVDGNHGLPSGLWGEFREGLYQHYGGPEALATGWVSNTQFEPHVGNQVWNALADRETTLTRMHDYHLVEVLKKDARVLGATFTNGEGRKLRIEAKVTIDATELGDVIARAGVSFLQGQDARSLTGEDGAPEKGNPYIQDLTYVAILKDFGPEADKTIEKPASYNASQFNCLCAEVCDDPERKPVTCDKMLQYGKLPNEKYMINWPNQGNDYYVNAMEMNTEDREAAFTKAKEHTLSMVYFIQTELGYRHLGLAEDEFDTKDHLPYIPYHRESRRSYGDIFLVLEDLQYPYGDSTRPFFQYAVAVGDYPIDHHHTKNEKAISEQFPSIPSFSIPFGSLLPGNVEGLLAAEKNISVSHLVNGATRLQPCVILIGQTAGMAAGLAVETGVSPREVNIRVLQQQLLDAHCWLLPFLDTKPGSPYFQPLQKLGVSGIMKGHGVSYKWANQTWIYPDSTLSTADFIDMLERSSAKKIDKHLYTFEKTPIISRRDALWFIWQLLEDVRPSVKAKEHDYESSYLHFKSEGWIEIWDGQSIDLEKPLLRKELAYLIDQALDPFNTLPVPAAGK
ncbi:FAD-dependent oxidoreductase [Fulvivirga sp. M361]|uniref:FAD-dependent oxidoreductase n=1 Tax=Fulvivirga sp. M361 TaxID=2594266 RepID=UPI00117A633B|nr:FAD-dependent oxidoreductase [Fulvivirga sp. M361]TRX52193.1 FAD-dependent oxidoreductase [Fulvivirga sp. M361]